MLAGVLAAAALLVNTTPPASGDVRDSLLGPPPITGPTARAMDLAGTLTIDIAAAEERLDVSVISPSGGVEGATVDLSAVYPDSTTAELHPRPCGPGCFTQGLSLPEGETLIQITAEAPGWTGGSIETTLRWPPPPEEPERFDRMVEAMQAVEQLTVAESVTSGASEHVSGAPGPPGISVTGAQFVDLMPWAGGGVVDVRPIDGQQNAFAFYLAGSRMYFEVTTYPDGRLRGQRMVNPGHEIDHTFSYPDEPS